VVEAWTAPAPPHLLLARLLHRPHPVLLDSASDQSGQGQWSYLACAPAAVLRAPRWRPARPRDGQPPIGAATDPFGFAGDWLAPRPLAPHARIPFTGGAIGAWSYDLRYRLERLPVLGVTDLDLPDAWIGLYETLYAFDHRAGRGYLVRAPRPGEPEAVTRKALRQLRRLLAAPAAEVGCPSIGAASAVVSNLTRERYLAGVRRAQEYIAAGDIYQVNLSQRFSAQLAGSPYHRYCRLRRASPAPFAAYLDGGDFQILSSSPERFLRVRGREVETRPIKGTRPRGQGAAADARLAAELLGSEKDRAELLMIVDLERNDLGRVCEYGSIRVPRLFELESHPTVHHLVATITGRLAIGQHALDLLRAAFPGGSITGAPKVRAMEIIEELEPVHRSFYTGAIGYVGFDGNAEWNIAIRTMVATAGGVTFAAGGGIVADSVPELEYDETLHKARAMRQALCGESER
jgi:para-aminobenzoate synthetase component 1